MDQRSNSGWSRRQFLNRAAITTGVLAIPSSLLAACSPEEGATTTGAGATTAPGSTTAAGTPNVGGIARFGLNTGNLDLNPVTYTAQVDYMTAYNIYRGLTVYDPETGDYVLDMAESVEVSDDGTVWTYKLKEGILFHDGEELIADDVKFSVDTKLAADTASPQASYYPLGTQVEVVDKYTVRFVLPESSILLPSALGPATGAIFPERAYATLAEAPMGTGPFKFVSLTAGEKTVLERFDDFYGEGPYLDGVEFVALPEGSARVAALTSGEVHLIDQVPFERIPELEGNADIAVYKFPSTFVDFLMMNMRQAPFDDIRARQAVAHAIDRTELANVATIGQGGPSETLVSEAAPVKPSAPPLEFDPDLARSLVEELGLGGVELSILNIGAGFPPWNRAVEFIASACNEVGFNMKVENLEAGTWVQRSIVTPDFDLSYCGFIAGIDADTRTYPQFHSAGSLNWAGYNGGAEFDALLEAQRGELDPERRAEILTEIWMQLQEDVPWITPYWWPGAQAAAANIAGFKTQPEFYPFMETVYFV